MMRFAVRDTAMVRSVNKPHFNQTGRRRVDRRRIPVETTGLSFAVPWRYVSGRVAPTRCHSRTGAGRTQTHWRRTRRYRCDVKSPGYGHEPGRTSKIRLHHASKSLVFNA